MNTRKLRKILLTLCSALLLVSLSVGMTIAYLTDIAAVTNTFTVGNVQITLDELDVDNDDNADDNVTYGEGDAATVRDTANEYHLLPGKTYTKDPIVHVDNESEECYLFVKVVNGLADIEAAENDIAAQMAANDWALVEGETDVYAYQTAVTGGANVPVFEQFTISGEVEGEALSEYENETIEITAYAIQSEGFASPAAAWAAYSDQEL